MTWYEFDSFQFEAETRLLSRKGGGVVPLPRKAADLLLLFLENPETLLSNEALKARVWPGVDFVENGAVMYQVNAVQSALGKRPSGEKYIKNFPKRGYQLVVPVQKRCPDPAQMPANPAPLPQTIAAEIGPAMAGIEVNGSSPARWHGLPRIAYVIPGVLLVLLALPAMLVYSLAPAPRLSVTRYIPLTHDGLKKDINFLLASSERIYFKEEEPNGQTVAAVAVAGGGAGSIGLPPAYENIYDLSPLTSQLLVGRLAPDQHGSELWVVSMLGGSPIRIGDLRASSANWSPNRQQIAGALHRTLYVANADGSNRRIIAELPGELELPHWAPDGKTIRFSEKKPQNGDLVESLWEVGADGSNLHQLLDGWNNNPHECCGVWTPDGNFFVFQSFHEGRSDLWALSEKRNVFGRKPDPPIRLSSGLLSYSAPAVSADGKEIFAVGAEDRGELVRYDSKLKEFVPFLGGIDATWVNFSKTGRSVAYIAYPDSTVWRATLNSNEKSELTFPPFQADGLAWSPDEKWLAVHGRNPGKPWKIYLVPSGGGDAKVLIPTETDQGIPAWSPDGSRIAFGDIPPVHNVATGTQAIHILKLSDRTLSELPGSRGFWTARWSPDGQFLSALTIEGERLMLYDFRTRKWRSTQAENVNNPSWSRDSKYIYFDTEGDDRALRRVRVADGHVDQLVKMRTYPNLAWWWSGIAPDDSPLILRNLGSTEIYSLILSR